MVEVLAGYAALFAVLRCFGIAARMLGFRWG
jgi:hypothetical protein